MVCVHALFTLRCYIQDVELLSNLLEDVSFEDKAAVAAAAARFHRERKAHAATINVLANALYQVRIPKVGWLVLYYGGA